MDRADLGNIMAWALGGWFALMLAIVLVRMVTGKIALGGLLSIDRVGDFGFARLQLLAVTLLVAAAYVIAAIAAPKGSGLPDIPTVVLLALAGSHAAYLGSKLNI